MCKKARKVRLFTSLYFDNHLIFLFFVFFYLIGSEKVGREENKDDYSDYRKDVSNEDSLSSIISENSLTQDDESESNNEQSWSGKFYTQRINSIKRYDVDR